MSECLTVAQRKQRWHLEASTGPARAFQVPGGDVGAGVAGIYETTAVTTDVHVLTLHHKHRSFVLNDDKDLR